MWVLKSSRLRLVEGGVWVLTWWYCRMTAWLGAWSAPCASTGTRPVAGSARVNRKRQVRRTRRFMVVLYVMGCFGNCPVDHYTGAPHIHQCPEISPCQPAIQSYSRIFA